MFTDFAHLNWLAIAIATIAISALGALYFIVLVPKRYAIALGRQNAPAPKQTTLAGLGPVVCTLFLVTTSAVLIHGLHLTTVGQALAFGVIVGVGYLTAMTFMIAINPNFPRPLYYGLLNAPYFIAGALLASVILVLLS